LRTRETLKRFVKTIASVGVTLSIATALLSIQVHADSVEREWLSSNEVQPEKPKGFFNSLLPAKSTPAKPSVPIATQITPKTPKKLRSKRKKRNKRKAIAKAPAKQPVKKANSKMANWWKNTGNPAVFAFRDCTEKFAGAQVSRNVKGTPAQFITRAMKTSCQVDFAKMAGVLIGGLGEEKSNAMLAELVKTTFLPTVKSAIDVVENEKRAVAQRVGAKDAAQAKMQTAKSQMFACFAQKTDRLSVAKTTGANTIADSVIIGCQNKSDAFFDLLFANSKATSQEKLKQKNIALNETYRVAIIKRVLASRKTTQVKTATGTSPQ